MYRNGILGILVAATMALLPHGTVAQQKSMKDQLVGAWTVLLDDRINADGTQQPLYGPNPIGTLLVSPTGRYSVQIMRSINRAPFAFKNLSSGTPEENKAAIQGIVTHFGTYTVDEADKSLTFRIEGSSFPNLGGAKQKWQIDSLADDTLTIKLPAATSTNPAGGFVAVEVIWKRVK